MGEDAGRNGPGRRSVGFAGAVGLGALVGLFGGVIFGLRDAVRVCVTYEQGASVPGSFGGIIAVAGYSMLWYAVGGALLMSVVGAAIWAGARSRGRRLDDATFLGLAAAIFALVVLPAALWLAVRQPREQIFTKAGRLVAKLEVGLLALLCAAALGLTVRALRRRVGKLSTFAAASVGSVCALFVLACYGVWVNTVVFTRPLEAKPMLASAGVAAVACALGFGVYLLCRAALGWRRRPVKIEGRRGALITLGSATLLALAPALLGRRLHRALDWTTGDGPAQDESWPNILWIVMDTARADALSCYGYDRNTTPNLDAIASEGTLYERAFAASSWTLPSHASMFTGLLPSKHGATTERLFLDDGFTTIAEVLARKGYGCFGCSANYFVGKRSNLARGFARMDVRFMGHNPARGLLLNHYRRGRRMIDNGAQDSNRIAKRWIAECAAARRRFFVFINYMEPHDPYGSSPYFARWFPSHGSARKALALPQDGDESAAGLLKLSDDDFRSLRTLYDGDVTYLDSRIGQLVGYLRHLRVLDDTLLIITSDHGEEFGEHGFLNHGLIGLYNTLIRVPLIVRYPRRFAAGHRVKRIVETMDILPTILDILRIRWQSRHELHGRSLLDGGPPGTTRYAVAERYYPFLYFHYTGWRHFDWQGVDLVKRLRSIQDEDFKYVWASNGNDELYDLRKNPQETDNLIGELPHKATQLRALLSRRVGGLAERTGQPTAG